jgi:environmental stress-induced protein Ves
MHATRLVPPAEFRVMPRKDGRGRTAGIHVHPKAAAPDAPGELACRIGRNALVAALRAGPRVG